MADDDQKDWKQLCSEAAVEQNPKKLIELIAKLEKALKDKDSKNSEAGKPA